MFSRLVISCAWGLVGFALGASDARGACARSYTVGLSESGTFAYVEGGQLKGLIPVLVEELSRRTACQLIVQNMPRVRLWTLWEAGQLDIVTGALRTPERDLLGEWSAFAYVQEELITKWAPPGPSLEAWLKMPGQPILGRVRSSVSGDEADRLLARPEFAQQIDTGVDHISVIRKLFAGRNEGVLLPRPAFDNLTRQNGLDGASMPSYRVDELPRVAYGFYLRAPQVLPADRRLLASTLATLLASGFNETAYAAIVGKPVAARLFHGK